MSEDSEEWHVARRHKCTRKTKPRLSLPDSSHQEHVDVQKTVKRVKQIASDLRCDDLFYKWKEELTAALVRVPKCHKSKTNSAENANSFGQMQCVCYGLGSFSSCVSARYQLSMLLLLLDATQIELKNCSVYDPAFSSGERDVLQQIGLTVLSENEEGKRVADKFTLFYMMHCGKALYNNLLWKNWSTHRLSQMVIIGNSFCGMRDRAIDREFNQDYSYISQAVAMCEERLLPCPSHMSNIFSDTAVITFPSSSLEKLSQSTWVNPPEPQYELCLDLEIVLRNKDS